MSLVYWEPQLLVHPLLLPTTHLTVKAVRSLAGRHGRRDQHQLRNQRSGGDNQSKDRQPKSPGRQWVR